ncbi:MAG: MFS transporter [Brachymonas sp.]|jgi:EmrB/QacA subfamily drug resistance transporter
MPSTPTTPHLRPLLWLVAAALFIQTLDSTIVNTALPAMAESMGESALAVHGIVVSYTLTMALLIPASGWLADRWGTKRVFSASLLLFAFGSLLCALSSQLESLIAARVVQGVGASMLMPVGRLAVLRAVPRSQFLAAISFIAVPGLLGPLVGPSLGGWLVEYASWHWIFLINLPICAIGLYLARRYLPDFRAENPPPFDRKGYALLAGALLALSLSLELLSARSFGLLWPAVCFLLCLLCSALYYAHAQRLRHQHPLFALSLFRVTSLRIGLLGNVATRLGSSGMSYVIPLMLQLPLGNSPARAGLLMVPIALASIAAKRLATGFIGRWGYRRVLMGNTQCIGLCILSFALFTPHTPLPLLLLSLSVFGLCNSLQYTALNTVTLKDVSEAQASSANTLLSVVQMGAISLGLAAAAVVLGLYSQAMQVQAGSPDLMRAFRATFLTLGSLTLASSYMFSRLPRHEKNATHDLGMNAD